MSKRFKYHRLPGKLLRKNISIPQLLGYAFATLAGMIILFSAFCFREDVKPLFLSDSNLLKPGFMVVNKKISVLSAFAEGVSIFKSSEIDEIKRQDFVRSVSYFTPCQYQVKAMISLSGRGSELATEMFFESVPDKLLNRISNKEWKWDEKSGLIPIIIPRDYLNLYNFGFSGSQGLPQISESIIQQIEFQVLLYGNGIYEEFKGRIVGFSNDLNTILVPETFMVWSNNKFAGADEGSEKISRLIIEVKNPADPKIAGFFAEKSNYEVNDNQGEQGKLSYFLTILIIAVIIVGALVLLPAMGLMLLSINLMVYKDRQTLNDLLLLGFDRRTLVRPYSVLVVFLNITVGISGIVSAWIIRGFYFPKLAVLGITETSGALLPTIVFSSCFVLILTVLDVFWIYRKIHLCCR
ncbi:MAG: ABC transporter permease [Dysgonamonadaceae bacterium]|jgi:hypothetical protein|nr:ABC transporter permease [Dysgonamonadaceae bacterium]